MLSLLKFALGTFLIYTLKPWFTSSKTLPNIKLYGYNYRNISVCGIQICARNCLTESWCKSFNYDRKNLLCELNYATLNSGYVIANENYIYSDIAKWPKNIVGACANTTCNVREKCIVMKSGLPYCYQIAFCIHSWYTLDITTNMCYKVVTGMNHSWYDADNYCKSKNGRLISLDTQEKVNSIQSQINRSSNTTDRLWIGLTDVKEEGKFKWTNGNEGSFRYWTPGQPNDIDAGCPDNTLGADFVTARKNDRWTDDCWKKILPFICETDVEYKLK